MARSPTPDLKALSSRVRMAIARSRAALVANFSITTNQAGIPPAGAIPFNAPPFKAATTGKILVVAAMNVSPQAAGDEVEFILTKDGGGLVSNAFCNGVAGAGLPLCNATLFNVDSVPIDGNTHVYGIEAVLIQPGGHQIQVVEAGEVTVLVYELP